MKRAIRVNQVQYLDEGYAPDGVAGEYHVMSQICGWYASRWTIMGHVIKTPEGKYRRVWMS